VIPTRLNLAAWLLDARIGEGRGQRIAIRTAARTFSYAEVARRSAQYAHILAADDVRPEERVIVALPDGVDFAAALFGILRRGSVVVMVNPDTRGDEALRTITEAVPSASSIDTPPPAPQRITSWSTSSGKVSPFVLGAYVPGPTEITSPSTLRAKASVMRAASAGTR